MPRSSGSSLLAGALQQAGVRTAFVFQGGAIASALDAIAEIGIRVVPFDHELDAAYAAEGYVRSSGDLAVVMTTSGPGATNLLSGVCGSWFDGVPVLFITGQVRRTDRTDFDWNLQVGFQEVDVVPMVRGLTKFAARVYDPRQVPFAVTEAVKAMLGGRRGPALLDMTMNSQMELAGPVTVVDNVAVDSRARGQVEEGLAALLHAIEDSPQPLLLLGGGFQWQDSQRVRSVLESVGAPCVFTYGGVNCLPLNHDLNFGFIGPFGNPSANRAFVEASDLFILGARVPRRAMPVLSEELSERVRARTTWAVTTDPSEFATHPLAPEIVVSADIESFLLLAEDASARAKVRRPAWASRGPLGIPEQFFAAPKPSESAAEKSGFYEPRELIAAVDAALPPDSRVFVDVGQNAVAFALGLSRSQGQRLFSSWANSPMGYSLPAAIGASFGELAAKPVCVIGDGGLRTALSSLPNFARASRRMKTIVWENRGYATIIDHLQRMMGGRLTAVDESSGLAEFPLQAILQAAGIRVDKASENLSETVKRFLNEDEFDVLVVDIDPECRLFPLDPME